MTIKFREMLGSACFAETEQQCPSESWEDWVFQESRRRYAMAGFVVLIAHHLIAHTYLDWPTSGS